MSPLPRPRSGRVQTWRAMVVAVAIAVGVGLGAPARPAAAQTPPAQGVATSGTPLPEGMTAEQAQQWLRSDRFRTLAAELRCLVCQNQTLADSGAELAVDLRNEVLRQMAAGKDDAQIKSHLVARYGEFVLYRPTFGAHTIALWLGPAVLLAIGAIVLWRLARRPSSLPSGAAPPDAQARLERIDRLLEDDPLRRG